MYLLLILILLIIIYRPNLVILDLNNIIGLGKSWSKTLKNLFRHTTLKQLFSSTNKCSDKINILFYFLSYTYMYICRYIIVIVYRFDFMLEISVLRSPEPKKGV